METKLRAYIEELFRDVTVSRRTLELRDELSQNLVDRYRDLVDGGKSEEEAYNAAIASVGNIGDLIKDIENDSGYYSDPNLKRTALMTTGAVMLYIISVIPFFLLKGSAGWVTSIFIIACATGLIIFARMTSPKYIRAENTVVEEFREWQHNSENQKNMLKAIDSAIWCVCLALYFIISFATGAWHVTWIIFLITVAVSRIIRIFFELKN